MSDFDDLLADFGDPPAKTSTGPASNGGDGGGGSGLDFDPFGPSDTSVTVTTNSSGGGDSGLLLDFSSDTQVQNGDSNGLDAGEQSSSANPLYDMSAQSSNPLYDLSSSGNPLYDLSATEGDVDSNSQPSANPLYDLDANATSEATPSANPLYEFEQLEDGDTSGNAQEVDLLSGGAVTQEVDLLSSPTNGMEEVAQQQEEVTEARVQSGQFDDLEYSAAENQDQQQTYSLLDLSPQEQPADQSDTKEEVVIQEDEVIRDGVTVSKGSRSENRFSDSGLESKQIRTEEYTNTQLTDANNRQTNEQDTAYFNEMSTMKGRFDSEPAAAPAQQFDVQRDVMSSEGGVYENEPQTFQQWQNEEEEEGVHESQPIQRDDVAREADKDIGAELPAVGTASNIKAMFMSQPADQGRSKREITPPAHGSGGEYVSEPRAVLEKYEGRAEAGVFESQPQHNPDVVTSEMVLEEAVPEQGFARNVAARVREMESKGSVPVPSGKREITPDRSGRVEFVSEPRGQVEQYEGHAESGVFESQPVANPEVVRSGQEVEEQLPERGMAKNLAQKFRQISTDGTSSTPVRAKREMTPDTASRVEYVSEPRGHVENYQPQAEAGVFENQPQADDTVVKSDELPEEYVPERGFARNVAAKFREMESTAKSPPLSPGRRKEFTPPRDETDNRESGVYESTPEQKSDVVHSGDMYEETLPERGTAKNMAQRFRQMEAENRSPQSAKPKKEFTPPPQDSGVYENQPDRFQPDYNPPAESGIVENQPQQRDDVVKGTEPPRYEEELPERGMARNLVSRWRQMESESAKAVSPGSGGRQKEFTPPRDEPRILEQRSPHTPLSPRGGQHNTNAANNGSVHPSELPGQYQPTQEPNVFESEPEHRPDVYREDDTDWTEGMPKKDTAKKMLARFQKIQSEAKQQEAKEHVPRKDTESENETETAATPPPQAEPEMEAAKLKFEDPSQVARSKSMRAAIQTEKCGACEKTVYAMERLEMNKRVYHKACFRCTKCRAVLTPKTFAINNDVIFCTSHYKQLFATKGNYDEGFGRMQHKKRWNSHPNLAEGEEGSKVNGQQEANGAS